MDCSNSTVLDDKTQICDDREVEADIIATARELATDRGYYHGDEHPVLQMSMVRLAQIKKPKHYLEVGFQSADTIIPVSILCNSFGGKCLGIDNLADFTGVHRPMEDREDAFQVLLAKLHFYAGTQHQLVLGSAEGFVHDCQYDMVFIDHYKEFYVREFEGLVNSGALAPGAWVLFHDVDFFHEGMTPWAGVEKFVIDNGLGECYLLREGYKGFRANNLGLVTMKGGADVT